MRILFISNLFPDVANPVHGQVNATLLRHLSRHCETRVLALRPTLPGLAGKVRRLRPCEADAALQPEFVPVWYLPKLGSRLNHRLLARGVAPVLRRVRRGFAYDAILCAWIYPDVCGVARAAARTRVPVVGIAQGTDVHRYLELPVRRRVIVETLRRLPATITRSRDLARRLGDAGVPAERLHPIHNGVDTQLFHPGEAIAARRQSGLPLGGRHVLYVGNLLPVKNPGLLLHAFAELKDAARLVLVGEGPLRESLQNAAEALGIGERVVWKGRQNPEQVATLMRAADVLCLPSDNEGVPNVALEAMASGRPVVGTRVGGVPEVVDAEFLGTLVERGDQAGLVRALASWLNRVPDAARIRGHAEKFSWESAAQSYLGVLERVIAGTAGRRAE